MRAPAIASISRRASLGYDRDAGTLDFLVRFDNCGGHCPAHRHITATSVLVLQGEQHLQDMLPGGERVAKVRKAGEYHLTTGDKHPHMERGGPDGALSSTATTPPTGGSTSSSTTATSFT